MRRHLGPWILFVLIELSFVGVAYQIHPIAGFVVATMVAGAFGFAALWAWNYFQPDQCPDD